MFKSLALRVSIILSLLASFALAVPTGLVTASSGGYDEVKLVSDLPNVAQFQDPNLVNAWGLSHSDTSPWWVSDNGAGVSTLYNGNGQAFPTASPLVVNIPMPNGQPGGTPTGNVFNTQNVASPHDFVISKNGKSGPSFFLFATEDGTISGWNPTVNRQNAVIVVDQSPKSAVYKGLAFAHVTDDHAGPVGNFIYAANFHSGWVEMYDSNFALAKRFTDQSLRMDCPLPRQCFAPFGIQNINGWIYVTYALQNSAKHDDVRGAGNGFVDVFTTNGQFVRRFASHGALNSPWGVALAPSNFGVFSDDLLIGNFGDGMINAYQPGSGAFVGQMKDTSGNAISINGLWGIAFGNGANAGATNELFFASGLNDEADGLFGKLVAQP